MCKYTIVLKNAFVMFTCVKTVAGAAFLELSRGKGSVKADENWKILKQK